MTAATPACSLFDTHVHLDLTAHPVALAEEAKRLHVGAFSCTVTPQGYLDAQDSLGRRDGIFLGLGAHPWWVADGRVTGEDLDLLESLIPQARFVGEVGLDFSPKHVPLESKDVQVAAFERIVRASVKTSEPSRPKVLSIHSVRAADTVLDLLEREGATERCRCVFHWFSGSSEELWRAIRAGCWFSLGERSMATGRGREYAKLIPADRLLTETDYPPREGWDGSAADIAASLDRAIDGIAAARKSSSEEVRELVARNAAALLD